jgi:hypothetical protein
MQQLQDHEFADCIKINDQCGSVPHPKEDEEVESFMFSH